MGVEHSQSSPLLVNAFSTDLLSICISTFEAKNGISFIHVEEEAPKMTNTWSKAENIT